MANHPGTVSLTIIDEIGVKSQMLTNVIVTDATTVANIETLANGLVGVTDDIIDGQIIAATFKLDCDFSGAKSAPVAGSRVEQTGLFNFEQASSTYKYGIDVPNIKNAVLVGGRIDLTDASVIAWKNYILATTATITFAGRVLNALLALLDVLLTFRKKRRQLDARSFEEA
jgi:hypothetical protein